MKYFTIYFGMILLSINGCTTRDASKNNVNIVLITIDTLRADHLACYGYHRNTSPNIDTVAENGIIFKNVIAPAPWTAPSMVSLFTSVYPVNHGVIHGFGKKEKAIENIQEVFSDEIVTLAEILKGHGYKTFGVASNPHLNDKFGFARGFDYFNDLPCLAADSVNKMIFSWNDAIKKANKYFLWIHYIDPHYPYYPRTPWIEKYTSKTLMPKLELASQAPWEDVLKLIPMFKTNPTTLFNFIALYDSEINYVDHFIGELIQKFAMNKDTLLIITSDHGEEFLEHNYIGHGNNLHRETIHIPLIIKLPLGKEKKIIENQVNLIDVMPTILQILSIKPPEQTLGKPLLQEKSQISRLHDTLYGKDLPHYNFSELDADLTLKTIMTPEWKYIYNYKDKTEQLYNIKNDPLELNSLEGNHYEQENQLREQLFQWVVESKKYPCKRNAFQLSPTEKEQLKTLGYMQ